MAEELDEAQLAELHAQLLALERSLVETLTRTRTHADTVELDQAAVGRVSRVDALQQQKMAQAQRGRAELRLKQVRVALQAFEGDDYGWCKRCGEPVGYRRLRARPESPCCVPCMAVLEKEHG